MPLTAEEVAYPKYSPLPLYAAYPEVDEARSQVSVEFGEALPVIELDNNTVLVRHPSHGSVRLKRADLVLSNGDQHILPGPNFQLKDRARILFWDSELRAQGFLQNGPSPETSPLLKELNISESIPALPVLDLYQFSNTLSGEVQMSQSLFPVSDGFLKNLISNEQQEVEKVELHLIVDGSAYARDFAQRRLNAFSRRVATSDNLQGMTFTRTIILENGEIFGPESIQLSGLRQLFPQVVTSENSNGALAQGFIKALEGLALRLEDQEFSSNPQIILILLGPAIRKNILDDPEFKAVTRIFQDKVRGNRFGVVIGAITPEPSDVPPLLLSQLGLGVPNSVIGFAEQIDHSILNIVDEVSALGLRTDLTDERCVFGQGQSTLCLGSQDMEAAGHVISVPDVAALEWIAVPLWHIVDGTTFVLEQKRIVPMPAPYMLGAGEDKDILINNLREHIEVMEEDLDGLRDLQATQSRERAKQVEAWLAREADLKASLDAAQMQHDALRSALVVARDDVAFLDARLKDISLQHLNEVDKRTKLQQDLEETSDKLRKAETQKQSLNEIVSELAAEKDRIEQRASDVFEENSDLASSLQQMNIANKELNELIARQEVNVESVRQALDREQSKSAALNEKLQALSGEQMILAAMLDERDAEIQVLEDEKSSLEENLKDKDAQLSLISAEMAAVKNNYNLTLTHVEEAISRSEELQLLIDDLKTQLEKLKAQNSVLLENEKLSLERTALLELQLSKLEREKSEQNKIIADLQVDNKTLEVMNNNMSAEILTIGKELNNREIQHSDLEVRLDELVHELDEVRRENSGLRASISISDARVADLQSERDEILNLLEDRSERLLQTQNALQEIGELTDINTTGEDLQAVIEKYKNTLLSAQEQILSLNNVKYALEDELKITKARLARHMADYAVESARSSSDLAQSRNAVSDLEARLAENEMELFELKKIETFLSDKLEKQNEQILQAENMLSALGDRLALEVSIESLSGKISYYNDILVEAIEQGVQLSNENDVLKAEISRMRKSNEYAQFKEDAIISALEESVRSKDESILKLKENIEKLQNENEDMRGRIEIAMGVAEENVQLISVIKNAEQVWINREAALQNEISLLSQKLSRFEIASARPSASDGNIETEQSTEQVAGNEVPTFEPSISLRPIARPQNLAKISKTASIAAEAVRDAPQKRSSPQRSPTRGSSAKETAKPDALAGSLFVRPSSARVEASGFQTSGGFFGN
jgi:hypothetical protein